MPKKIKIACAQVQYERLIDALKSYFEDGVCFLGRSYETCPGIKDRTLTCEKCLMQNIIRVEENNLVSK